MEKHFEEGERLRSYDLNWMISEINMCSVVDYENLTSKPQINNVTLSGNKTTADLGIIIPTSVAELSDASSYVVTTDSRLSDSRPASDVYGWAKEVNKPQYTASEIGAAETTHTHNLSTLTNDAKFTDGLNGVLHIWQGTEAEYNALSTKSNDTLYLIK